MLGIGWGEMLVISVVALIVVGPKDLPMMLRNLGKMMGTVRKMGNEFRRELDKAIAADEIREAKKAISDPLKQTSSEITREFNAIRNGKVQPSGKLKPAEAGAESVVDEIRAQAGMEALPKGRPETMAAAIKAGAVTAEPTVPSNAETTTAGKGEKPVSKPRATKAAKPAGATVRGGAAKPAEPDAPAAIKTPAKSARAKSTEAQGETPKASTAAKTAAKTRKPKTKATGKAAATKTPKAPAEAAPEPVEGKV